MVRDRETRMKESLKIMGLRSWVYALSFLIQRSIWMFFPTFFVTLFIWIFNTAQYTAGTAAVLFLLLWIFGVSMLAVTMVFQNVFTNPKLATMVMPFVFFLPTGIAMGICLQPVITFGYVNSYIQYLYWFPQFPFTALMVNLLKEHEKLEYFEVADGVSWFFLIIQTPLYYFLHLYIEKIKPDSYGVASHPCFCCKKPKEIDHDKEELDAENFNKV